ncbi:hypothetical protein [Chelatococcus sp.]|uniref:hypothetical protein n=1 Tax=Chelatococcus sp. TaxID=1953771 RepID=UPI001EB16F84|nr:hypothetical protein [Chelatococcus sp.]MBX3546874.1 hypothetical protein [Chelatococcus sp.]
MSLSINTILAIVCVAFAVVFAAGGVLVQSAVCAAFAICFIYSDLFPPTRNG